MVSIESTFRPFFCKFMNISLRLQIHDVVNKKNIYAAEGCLSFILMQNMYWVPLNSLFESFNVNYNLFSIVELPHVHLLRRGSCQSHKFSLERTGLVHLPILYL